ncbi:MAG: A/G-specific adenine glycosylase [Phycisphaeraceae bacterium]
MTQEVAPKFPPRDLRRLRFFAVKNQPSEIIDQPSPTVLRRRLLAWYGRHRRDLPWRLDPPARPDPYHILVSEAMLQQTQVATVISYYRRFLDRFPTLEALAAADEQEVLALWQGLGYYRRAQHLHAAACVIVADHASRVPDTAAALARLPGVGRYTAGAVASIAFDQPAPILDGNVARVLARVYAIAEPIDATATRTQLWQLAGELVPRRNAGQFNQALMELGALCCLPRNPQCTRCPLRAECRAHRDDRVHELPRRSPRREPVNVTHHVAIIERSRGRSRVYVFMPRPASGLWSNMWQFPTLELAADARAPRPADLLDWVREQTGLTCRLAATLDAFTHQTTHRTIRVRASHLHITAGRLRPRVGQWRKLDNLADLPLPNPHRRLVDAIQRMK